MGLLVEVLAELLRMQQVVGIAKSRSTQNFLAAAPLRVHMIVSRFRVRATKPIQCLIEILPALRSLRNNSAMD